MSGHSTPTLKDFLTPTSTKCRQHPAIGCRQYNLEVDDHHYQEFHVYAGEALREAYVTPEYLMSVLEREGFPGVAKLLEEKFPSEDNRLSVSVRTGDFGGVYLHRGLSLMECLTPWLVVRSGMT